MTATRQGEGGGTLCPALSLFPPATIAHLSLEAATPSLLVRSSGMRATGVPENHRDQRWVANCAPQEPPADQPLWATRPPHPGTSRAVNLDKSRPKDPRRVPTPQGSDGTGLAPHGILPGSFLRRCLYCNVISARAILTGLLKN